MRIISIIVLLFVSTFIYAQDYVDLAKFHYATTPENSFDSIDGRNNVEEFGADIPLPIPINDSYTILTGFYLDKKSNQSGGIKWLV